MAWSNGDPMLTAFPGLAHSQGQQGEQGQIPPPWSAPPTTSAWPPPVLGGAPPLSPFYPPSPWAAPPNSPWPTSAPPLSPPPTIWDLPNNPNQFNTPAPIPTWLAPPTGPFAHPAGAPGVPQQGHNPSWAPVPETKYEPMFYLPAHPLQRSISARTPAAKVRRGTDTFSEDNLAKRPRDWREDYVPPSKTGGFNLGRIMRSKSLDRSERAETLKRSISPFLDPALQFALAYDLRLDPPPSIPHVTLYQVAVLSPVLSMTLYHPRLPWRIFVRASQASGVTIADVVHAIHENLHEQIRPGEYWTDALGSLDREEINKAFGERCAGRQEVITKGVLRVDFLGEECVFGGIVKSRKGWEIKTRKG